MWSKWAQGCEGNGGTSREMSTSRTVVHQFSPKETTDPPSPIVMMGMRARNKGTGADVAGPGNSVGAGASRGRGLAGHRTPRGGRPFPVRAKKSVGPRTVGRWCVAERPRCSTRSCASSERLRVA